MFNSHNLQIGNITNSKAIIINGDVAIDGKFYGETKNIFLEILRNDFEKFSMQAAEQAKTELENFLEILFEKLAKEKLTSIVENFKLPAVQVSLHDTLMGYIVTEDIHIKHFIVDVLIDRLKMQDNTIERTIINDAINIIPKLSLPTACLIALMALRQQVAVMPISFMLDFYFMQLSPIVDNLKNVTNLDIEYIKQNNCTVPITGLFPIDSFENHLLRQYDLFFRQKGSFKKFIEFSEIHPEVRFSVNDLGTCMASISRENSEHWQFCDTNSTLFYNRLRERQQEYLIPLVEELKKDMPIFSKLEVREYLISINSNWSFAFDLLNSEALGKSGLSILGNYIGSKLISKHTHSNALSISNFSNPIAL
jgi:hypothetical protein